MFEAFLHRLYWNCILKIFIFLPPETIFLSGSVWETTSRRVGNLQFEITFSAGAIVKDRLSREFWENKIKNENKSENKTKWALN